MPGEAMQGQQTTRTNHIKIGLFIDFAGLMFPNSAGSHSRDHGFKGRIGKKWSRLNVSEALIGGNLELKLNAKRREGSKAYWKARFPGVHIGEARVAGRLIARTVLRLVAMLDEEGIWGHHARKGLKKSDLRR
jgi:hypothetical protein